MRKISGKIWRSQSEGRASSSSVWFKHWSIKINQRHPIQLFKKIFKNYEQDEIQGAGKSTAKVLSSKLSFAQKRIVKANQGLVSERP